MCPRDLWLDAGLVEGGWGSYLFISPWKLPLALPLLRVKSGGSIGRSPDRTTHDEVGPSMPSRAVLLHNLSALAANIWPCIAGDYPVL